jgi:hypothetical protein
VKIAGHSIKADKHVIQALADLTSVVPADCRFPKFSISEIINSQFCNDSESFDLRMTVAKLEDLINIE